METHNFSLTIRRGIFIPVDFSVTTDLKNSSFRVLDLDQPGLGMAREYLMKGLGEPDVQVRV